MYPPDAAVAASWGNVCEAYPVHYAHSVTALPPSAGPESEHPIQDVDTGRTEYVFGLKLPTGLVRDLTLFLHLHV